MNTTAIAIAPRFRSYVSVMPTTGRPIDLDVSALTAAGCTYRGLGHGPIVYVFTELPNHTEARDVVALLIGGTGTVVDSGTAEAGAGRVTIDPRLIVKAGA